MQNRHYLTDKRALRALVGEIDRVSRSVPMNVMPDRIIAFKVFTDHQDTVHTQALDRSYYYTPNKLCSRCLGLIPESLLARADIFAEYCAGCSLVILVAYWLFVFVASRLKFENGFVHLTLWSPVLSI